MGALMIKFSKYLIGVLTCYIFINTGHAQVTIYTPKNDLGWQGFDIHYVAFDGDGKTSNKEFDKRMKTQVNILNSYYSDKLKAKQNLNEQLQVECDYLTDAKNLLAVYLNRYPKLLQQPEAKILFYKSREYYDHFEENDSKCNTLG